jgi:hypothetical protein
MIEGATGCSLATCRAHRINVTAGCATSVAGLRAPPRDYIPPSPDLAGPPIGNPGSDGPNDGPGPQSEWNNR